MTGESNSPPAWRYLEPLRRARFGSPFLGQAKNAVFSGKVIESVAKTSTEPSRLAIRMDSVQWKDGSAAVKIYLTAWIYPTTVASGQDLQYGPQQSQARPGTERAAEFTSGKAISGR